MAKKVKRQYLGDIYRCNITKAKLALTDSLTKEQLELINANSPILLEDVKPKKKTNTKPAATTEGE